MPRDSENVILQLYARTPAPCRDYCGLTITEQDAILNIWNITYGPHVYPRRHKCLLENFEQDKYLQMEVMRVFGEHVFDYVMSISNNERKLQNLPTKLFLQVLKYLAVKDVLHLSQTSKILFERCEMDNTWKLLFRRVMKRRPDRQDLVIAGNCGWKETLKQKLLLQGRRGAKSGVAPAKTATNKIGGPKRVSFADNKINVKQHSVGKETGNIARSKLDTVKSTSALTSSSSTPNNLKKTNQVKSVVNLSQVNSYSRSLTQTRNDLKLNKTAKSAKNTNIVIQTPPSLLEKFSSFKTSSLNSKPTSGQNVAFKYSSSAKNKSDTVKK